RSRGPGAAAWSAGVSDQPVAAKLARTDAGADRKTSRPVAGHPRFAGHCARQRHRRGSARPTVADAAIHAGVESDRRHVLLGIACADATHCRAAADSARAVARAAGLSLESEPTARRLRLRSRARSLFSL